jgi:hypothetical protein
MKFLGSFRKFLEAHTHTYTSKRLSLHLFYVTDYLPQPANEAITVKEPICKKWRKGQKYFEIHSGLGTYWNSSISGWSK